MQELVGRLTALDPEASESLKVISYFDALVDGHASIEVLLRGAAVLSGQAAGCDAHGVVLRVAANGVLQRAQDPGAPDPAQAPWPSHPVAHDGRVWIERSGPAHANDEMILERLALAVAIVLDRTPAGAARRALETVIDAGTPPTERLEAARRLSLDAGTSYRVVAAPAAGEVGPTAPVTPSVVVETPFGRVRVGVAQDHAGSVGPVGIGLARRPEALDESWASALVALRLTDEREPVVRADDLGILLALADAADGDSADDPDLTALRTLLGAHPAALPLLESLAVSESVRAVALDLGFHHSTVQAHLAYYGDRLGFDLRTPRGRVRLSLALSVLRLTTRRFD
ncbi:hypothetical protein GCM10025867_11280 [Frondihabitans sucicola]|uniref:PucR C-terminal helix-turn-helix domain-containing protein n=1 Tax=Frondihabitans sucicola TaxID=1268041 RepID=A0ABM8GKG9_9MICO|nr:helix-turn-helix domain-containing protein [Frondihabitans sucicola]BDZ48887.1 hypothetical protein GCM10025867_11280 [Frondihabitans sucicola]